MSTLSPHILIQQGEGLTLEFKEHFTPRIAEDMVAFANSRGGSILLGVRDNGALVEERLTNSLKAQILSVARNCSPPIEVQARQIDKAIEIIVPEGQEKPYSCSSGYFRRLDAATQKMSRKELALLFQKFDRVPFEERLCTAAVRKDVSSVKVRNFMQKAGSGSRRIPVESFLKSLRLVESAGIRNAALLLFGEKPWNFLHQCELVCIRFSDKDGVDIFDRMDDRGDLVSQFQTAIFFIQKHLHRRSVIQGTYRKDVYDIPEEAFREALANAIVHRDYSIQGTSLTVRIFDDRMEIINPGGLPDGLPQKDFGRVSLRRNELVCDVFQRLGLVERAGTGIQRMREALAAAKLPALEIHSEDFFAITLRRQNLELLEGTGKKYGEKVRGKSTGKILDLIAQNPKTTIPELAKALKIGIRPVEKHIARLKAAGLLRRVGPAKGGHWEVDDGN